MDDADQGKPPNPRWQPPCSTSNLYLTPRPGQPQIVHFDPLRTMHQPPGFNHGTNPRSNLGDISRNSPRSEAFLLHLGDSSSSSEEENVEIPGPGSRTGFNLSVNSDLVREYENLTAARPGWGVRALIDEEARSGSSSPAGGRSDQGEMETDALIGECCSHGRRSGRSSRPRSVCSTADLRGLAVPSNYSNSGEDDVLSSNDSHCHTNNKRSSFDKKARSRLIIASILCLLFMIGEMVGGLLAHSLAIISDAAHLLTDFASFMISLMALYLAHRPATKKLSFGWYRIEILGAFVSILMLWVLTGILVYSAALRIMDDNYEIDATVMLITAATGVAFNIVLGLTLHQHGHSHGGGGHGHSHGGGGHSHGGESHGHSHEGEGGHSHKHSHDSSDHSQDHKKKQTKPHKSQTLSSSRANNYGSFHDIESADQVDPPANFSDHDDSVDSGLTHVQKPSNINVKAAFIHVLGDLLQSVGVLVAAFIIFYKPEWKVADPICTFMFSLFVLITTLTIMRDILVVLMEGTPRGINFIEVRNTFFKVEGVLDIHNLRVWSLTMDKIALSVHLAIDKQSDPHKVLKAASLAIKQKFNISETTMQIEEYVTEMIDCQDCQGPQL